MGRVECYSRVKCFICGKEMKRVTNSHLRNHNITVHEYNMKFPSALLSSALSRRKFSQSMKGKKVSIQTRRKISLKHKGKRIPDNVRKKISLKMRGRKLSNKTLERRKEYYMNNPGHFEGRKHSESAKKKISIAGKGRIPWNKGKSVPKEVREKISRKLKGNKLSLDTRKKMSLARKGRIISQETREKISKAKKGKKMTEQYKRNMMLAISKSPNKFEVKCSKLFKENNLPLKFVGSYNNPDVFIAGRVPDFIATNGMKIVVEVFYSYFKIKQYGSVEDYKLQRKALFARSGWKTVFFTYKEINENWDECLERLKEILK